MKYLPACFLLPILLLASASLGSCDNIGSLWTPGGGSNEGGGGAEDPGPSSAPFDGALLVSGRPRVSSIAPANGSLDIDAQGCVALWFSESLQRNTVTTLTVSLRVQGTTSTLGYSGTWFCGDRLLVMAPSVPLIPATTYEVTATTDVTDIDGQRLSIPASGLLGSFTTHPLASGVPPQVLGSFPAEGAEDVPNDHSVVVVFSKPILFSSLGGGAVSIRRGDSTDASFLTPTVSQVGGRVVEYEHSGDSLDLNETLTFLVADTVLDTEFEPNPLSADWSATWESLDFGRPESLDLGLEPAVNLNNLTAFPVDVDLGSASLATDTVQLRFHESPGESSVDSSLAAAADGASTVSFNVDLSDGQSAPVLSEGNLSLGTWVTRQGLSTTAVVNSAVELDVTPPSLTRFGPPFAFSPGTFLTDLPELRPYGLADDEIRSVRALEGVGQDFTRSLPSIAQALELESSFFIGPPLTMTAIQKFSFAEVDFSVELTDSNGNLMADVTAGRVEFRGWLGDQSLSTTGALDLMGFDARSLLPVIGADVRLENLGGADVVETTTDVDGTLVGGAVSRTGPQVVSLVHPSFRTTTFVGLDCTLASLPLAQVFDDTQFTAPVAEGVSGGEVRLASPLLRAGREDRLDGFHDDDLPFGFGTAIGVRPDRPGWFAGLHRDTSGSGAFTRSGLDPRNLVQPASTSVGGLIPILGLTEHLNVVTHNVPSFSLGGGLATTDDSTLAPVYRIPGIVGVAPVGTGATNGAGIDFEEIVTLSAAAVQEDPGIVSSLQVQARGRDSSADETALVRALPTAPSLTLPDIPRPQVLGFSTGFPITLQWDDSLGSSAGVYRLLLTDGSAEWEIWAGATAASGSFLLPDFSVAPLDTQPGATWSLRVQAFGMSPGFTEGAGWFFTDIQAQLLNWAESAEVEILTFQ